jgi:hypothetical protein
MRSALVFAAALTAFTALPAAADPGHHGPALINAVALRAEATPAGVHVHMTLDDSRVRHLRRRGLDPGLAVDLGGRTEVLKLMRVTDVLLRTRRAPAYVKVYVVDRSPQARHQDLALTLGGILVDTVKLPVLRPAPAAPPPPPAPTAWSEHPAVIDACRSALPYGQRRACELAVDHARRNPAPLVRTCDRAFVGSDDTLTCIRVGLGSRTAFAPLVEACDRAFVGSIDTLTCLRTTAAAPRSLVSDLDACDRAFVGSVDTLTCVRHAAAAIEPMTAVIGQCDQTFVSQADELACMQLASTAPSMSVARTLIAQCDAHRGTDRHEMRCVERQLGERVAHRGRAHR